MKDCEQEYAIMDYNHLGVDNERKIPFYNLNGCVETGET